MTTMTDDIGPRLAAVEAHIGNINTQLAEINANQRQLREENQAMRAEHQADIRYLHERIDQTNAKIDRLLYTVIGIGVVALASLIGIIGNLILTLLRTT